MTLKQKQEKLKKLLKQKEANEKNWKRLQDLITVEDFEAGRKIKKFIKEMQDFIFGELGISKVCETSVYKLNGIR